MSEIKKISAAILAGGKSIRMGTDKGLLPFRGSLMIEHVINLLSPIGTMLIANKPEYYRLGYPVFSDIKKDAGPLGGIYTALEHSKTEKMLILSCDTPFISRKFIDLLLSEAEGEQDVTVPVYNGRFEPLCAVYSTKCKDRLFELLISGELKLQYVLKQLNRKEFVVTEEMNEQLQNSFKNINTPEDYEVNSN